MSTNTNNSYVNGEPVYKFLSLSTPTIYGLPNRYPVCVKFGNSKTLLVDEMNLLFDSTQMSNFFIDKIRKNHNDYLNKEIDEFSAETIMTIAKNVKTAFVSDPIPELENF